MQIAAGHELSVSFVTRRLFDNVNFQINNNSHVGLVGMNGCGKSTLFKVISGRLQPDQGQVTFSRETRLAYMEQFLSSGEDDTLYQAVRQVFADLIKMDQQINQINDRLEENHSSALIAEQQSLREQYADRGGYTYEARIRSTLLGLGFEERDLLLPVKALSGGQRSKAALARVLLSDANLLLLDEPTNHLDIASIEWLENFLSNYRGAFVVISHDRYFLDKVTNETWAFDHGSLRCFSGNYSAHLEKKAGQDEAVRRRYQNQMREIRRIEGIIAQQKKFNQARNYVTIASKQKQLDRIKAELVAPESAERTLGFNFNSPPPGGNDVLELHQLSKSFGGKRLFGNLDLHVQRGERIFLLGRNGCGKSTLMKIIVGQEQADSGLVQLGTNIIPAYYDQIHSGLSGSESILEYFTAKYPLMTQTHIRTMLGSFLFSGESVEKSISDLSGGEKARLQLLELIMQPANLLLLDEPSNHLDIDSKEAVEEALMEYPGAMLVVSHDRYLINRLADRIYHMDENGLSESIGNYDDYLEQLNKGFGIKTSFFAPADVMTGDDKPAEDTSVSTGADDYRRRKEIQAEQRRLAKKKSRLQEEIAQKEEDLDGINEQIAACAPEDYLLLMEFAEEKDKLEEELLELMENLEDLGNCGQD